MQAIQLSITALTYFRAAALAASVVPTVIVKDCNGSKIAD